MEPTYEVLREVWRITERRNGAVYKTELVGTEWVPMDSVAGRGGTVGDLQYVAPTDIQPIIRRRATPDKEDGQVPGN